MSTVVSAVLRPAVLCFARRRRPEASEGSVSRLEMSDSVRLAFLRPAEAERAEDWDETAVSAEICRQ